MITLEGKHSVSSMNSHVRNIAAVVQNRLCTGCGTCVGVCPSQALEMAVTTGLLLPNVDAEKCTDCRLCIQSCPGFSLNMVNLNSQVFGQPPSDAYVGCFQTCYVGHTNDREVSSVLFFWRYRR